MMFCRRCGKQLPDDAAFCIRCGTKCVDPETESHSVPESGPAPEPTAQSQMKSDTPHRDAASASSAAHAGPHTLTLGQLSAAELIELLQPLNEKFVQIRDLEHGIQSAYGVMKRNNTEYYAGLGCFLLSGLFCAGALLFALASASWDRTAPIIALVACLIGLILLILGFRQRQVYQSNIENVVSALYPAIAADEHSIEEIRKSMQANLLRFPITCRNAEASAYMLQMLMCGRASDFNTAVNLWESYDHRQRMEQFEREKVQEARKQTTALTVSAVAQVSQAFESRRQTKELRGLREDLSRRL